MTASTSTSSLCRSCEAPIRWVVTAGGKLMPLDLEPNPAGSMVLTGNYAPTPAGAHRVAPVAKAADLLDPADAERYMPHHATCPQGRAWRRP